jgi:hypothetical protein
MYRLKRRCNIVDGVARTEERAESKIIGLGSDAADG